MLLIKRILTHCFHNQVDFLVPYKEKDSQIYVFSGDNLFGLN